jgi:3-hydroxyacyl-CoA dehydrogenase
MVIEAVFEEMGVKEKVFKQLDAVMKPGAILASNTSTLDVNAIAAFTKRPQDVIGTHFFSPANVMKLLEVVRGEKTAKDVLATVMALAKKIRKTAVVSGVCDGFIGNRMIEQYGRQGGFLLEEGCTPAQVDKAIEKWGMAMGPFRMGDLAGNDIGWAIRKRRYVEKPNMRYSKTADLLCEMGRYGQKTGAGWYDYQAGKRDAIPSDVVVKMIEDHRAALGHPAAQDQRRRDRAPAGVLAGQRGGQDPGRRHRQQGQRHRHGLPHRLWLPAAPRRADVLCRSAGLVQCRADHEEVRRQSAGRRQLLAARATVGQAGG